MRRVGEIAGLALALGVSACGGAEGDDGGPSGSECGPFGVLIVPPGGEARCACVEGYEVEDGQCVEEVIPGPDEPTGPECGENGAFDGRSCVCDQGYTQTGAGLARTCELVPACVGPNDVNEPNDAWAEATRFGEMAGPLYACPAEEDWYTLNVESGDEVDVRIQFDGGEVDLDLFLFGPSSLKPRAFAVTASGNAEQAKFVARASGTAGIVVLTYGVGEGGYQMDVQVEEGNGPQCVGPWGACRAPADCCSGFCHIDHCH